MLKNTYFLRSDSPQANTGQATATNLGCLRPAILSGTEGILNYQMGIADVGALLGTVGSPPAQ